MASSKKKSPKRSPRKSPKRSKRSPSSRFKYKKVGSRMLVKNKKDIDVIICAPGYYKKTSPTGKIICARLPRRK